VQVEKSVVYLGYSSFPYGLAEVQKIILISKCLLLENNKVKVICRNGFHNKSKSPGLTTTGIFENIEYVYASGSCYRNDSFFWRRINEIKGRINEFLLLKRMKKKDGYFYAILSTRQFGSVLYYVLLSRLFRFKTVLNYVEYYTAFKKGKFQFSQKINDRLFDRYAPRMVNGVLPISEFLIQHIEKVAPGRKYLKLPGLTDFDKYENVRLIESEPYFLFCGSASYKEIIFFVIDSFFLLKNNTACSLYLVVSGRESEILEVKNFVSKQNNPEAVKFFSGVAENTLYSLYKNAKALLIPLRPTFQDAARFPHKTGEYLASGNPVISTNYGEMKYYFEDGVDMLLADNYDEKQYAEKMQFIIDAPGEAAAIGLRGKCKAYELFDCKKRAPVLNEFFTSLS
jgi:glycosyltransferase involved in cell wall biosynthesis